MPRLTKTMVIMRYYRQGKSVKEIWELLKDNYPKFSTTEKRIIECINNNKNNEKR